MTTTEMELVDIERLVPYVNNARTHSPEQIQKLRASLREFGFINPVIIDREYNVIAGHGRIMAARAEGIGEVPCVYADHLNEAQKRAYILADNRMALDAGWDEEKLKNEILALQDMNFNIGLTGVEDSELADLILDLETPIEENNFDTADEVPEEPTAETGQIYKLGRHRLICGDSTDVSVISKLMQGKSADLWLTDPPYNVDYEGSDGQKIKNDSMGDAQFREFLKSAFAAALSAMKPGAAFYIWHADSEGYNFRGACRDVGLKVRQCLIWVKNSLVLGRQDYQWRHEPCQPAGTMVKTPNGEKPIENLKDGDVVLSWDSYSGAVKGYKNGGYRVKTANRDYNGELYGVKVGDKMTWATDNHQFSVRFNPNSRKNYCTYLMQRDDKWRVGIAKAYDARQFGLKTRYHQEKADNVWLISLHDNKIEAQVMEQILTVKYGIPYTVWEPERNTKGQRTPEQIEVIYAALDKEKMKEGAMKLLRDFHRSYKYPLITKENKADKFSTRVTARINACNLVPELMQVPIPTTPSAETNFEWQNISRIETKHHNDKVYSLSVEKYEHYIADGIVTHNCLYGWNEGAAHYFIDNRAQTTVVEDYLPDFSKMKREEMKALLEEIYSDRLSTTVIYEDKPKANDLHPTMKPIKLLARLIRNSSKPDDIVLDTFGGSGSTLIACEQLGRTCYTCELDPKYVDVIIKRWEDFTGMKAELET